MSTHEVTHPDPDITCRRKTAFLVSSLLSDDDQTQNAALAVQARSSGVIEQLVAALTGIGPPYGKDGDQQGDVRIRRGRSSDARRSTLRRRAWQR